MRRKKDNFKVLKGTTHTSMKISKRSSLLLITMLLISCARYPTIPSLEEIDPSRAPSPLPELFQEKATALLPVHEAKQKDYVIGPEDVLRIQVWDHPDMDREVHVSREGEFSYPLIGKVHADGLTVVELEKEITRRLDISYIINPQVTVAVNQFHSKKVFFLGEIVSRGTYPLTGKTTLLEILAQAGGPTPEAGTEVILIRPRNHIKKENPTPLEEARDDDVIHLDVQQLMNGDMSQNIFLQNGDTIYITKAQYYYVFGEVERPGKFLHEKSITVLKALTTAGGITDVAAVNRTKIVREKEGMRVKFKVKMNDAVMPEDIIIVPESFF